jgi:hypothetical protein
MRFFKPPSKGRADSFYKVCILSISLGYKYDNKSHKLVTVLMCQIECQTFFSSPTALAILPILGNESALPSKG